MFLLLLLLSLSSLSPARASPSPGCGSSLPAQPHPGHHHRLTVSVSDPGLGEVSREVSLHLPAQYDLTNSLPVPLVLDYHGWGGTLHSQMVNIPWRDVADLDTPGFLYVAMGGMNDVVTGGSWGSWNVSRDAGPLGRTCVASLHQDYPCYSSCGGGDCSYLENSCDWTSCHDDIAFTEAVLTQLLSAYCVDTEQIHMSGISNGGMFIWTRALARLSASLASVAPVCGSPLRGYNVMPDSPLNIIDFHGLNDRTIPFSPEGPGNLGEGPDDTTISKEGYYYHTKMIHLGKVLEHMNCEPQSVPYLTHMDGHHGFNCQLWSGCDQGKEVVQCNGNWTHSYPFHNRYIEGIIILWDFMKRHPQQANTGY